MMRLAISSFCLRSCGEWSGVERRIFPDLYREVERDVLARAKTLIYKTERERRGRITARKRQALLDIVNPESGNTNQI
jgi:hypothetical protein